MARHRASVYWGRPVPGFGDPHARLLLVGLAPAAHGGQSHRPRLHGRQPGRLRRAALRGVASRRLLSPRPRSVAPTTTSGSKAPTSPRPTAAPRRPTGPRPTSATRCLPYLGRELRLLADVRVILALGAFAWEALSAPARARRSPARPEGRASVTAQRRRWGHTVFSAATTPASRTPSPADSRQPCSTRSLRAPASWQGDA